MDAFNFLPCVFTSNKRNRLESAEGVQLRERAKLGR